MKEGGSFSLVFTIFMCKELKSLTVAEEMVCITWAASSVSMLDHPCYLEIFSSKVTLGRFGVTAK